MSGFLYYIPGLNGIAREQLASNGLEHLATCNGVAYVGSDGPVGRGIVFGITPYDHAMLRYSPDEQTWRNAGKFWLGYWNESKPTSDDLQRSELLNGWSFTLAGCKWNVAPRKSLPRYWDLTDAGEWEEKPSLEASELDALAARLYDLHLFESGKSAKAVTVSKAEMLRACELSLSLGYYVSKWEIAALRLLDGVGVNMVTWALLDIVDEMRDEANQQAAVKKNDAPDAGSTD